MYPFSTLFVRDLIFFARHGATGREVIDRQRFKVDIEIELMTDRCEKTDLLSDTYDYKHAEDIARTVIEGEHHLLIEVLAGRIAGAICDHPHVHEAEVVITKLDADSLATPGVRIRKKRIIQQKSSRLLDFDIKKIISTLEKEGGVSFPLIGEDYRNELLAEAERYTYVKQEEIVGPNKVREQLSSCKHIPAKSVFYHFAKDFQETFLHKLIKLNLSELSLQLYEQGSLGITPHRDWSDQINMICNVMLVGEAKVALCDDREGRNPRYLDTTPGNMTILRAPGFLNSDIRPFHFVKDVTSRRIVFGMRQKKNI